MKVTNVLMFTGDKCPGCDMAKKVFTECGIPFETIDLFGNMDKAREYGFRSVPGFVVESESGVEMVLTGKENIPLIVDMFKGEDSE